VVGAGQRLVQRVAVCTGAGASFIAQAARAGADVYVTGDVKHHEALQALELGLAIVDPGHAPSERHAVDMLAELLLKQFPSLKVARSRAEVEPFH
jgi:putative NIF3 family GTP cyclohydrolase 1 type 2